MLNIDERIRYEQLKLFALQMRSSAFGNLITLVVVSYVFWGTVNTILVVSLFGLMVAIVGLRVWLGNVLLSIKTEVNVWNWTYCFVFLTAMAGSVWGYIGFQYFMMEHPWQVIFISVVILSLPAAASITHSALMPAYYVSAYPMTLGLLIRYLMEAQDIYYILAFTSFIYLIGCTLWSRNLNKTFVESIKLRFENNELIDKLKQQKEKAENAKQQAESANVAKSRFFAAASHDLRQPLHALGLYVHQLEASSKPADFIPGVKNSMQALTSLLDSLLDTSKLDSGNIDINKQHIYIREILKHLQNEFAMSAGEKNIKLKIIESSSVIHTDPLLLERVIRNLIANAINYTESGKVVIGCRNQKNSIRIEIWDTGIGIEKQEWNNIFNEFHQLANPERNRKKGLGLGLSIVKQLCNLLNIKIDLNSVPDKGSVFYLTVPRGQKDLAIARFPETEVANEYSVLKGLVVLVIDDELSILEAMRKLLKNWQCIVFVADSIDNAQLQIQSSGVCPDIILSDYHLRGVVSGVAAIKSIRACCEKDIPALLISGDTAPDVLKIAQEFKCHLLHKPVKPAKLRAAIDSCIR